MLECIEEILSQFRKCFSRTAAYSWFVTIITGLMICSDHPGVTSVIRDLGLRHKLYETMMHFFGHLMETGVRNCSKITYA